MTSGALKFDSYNMHLDKFVCAINPNSHEIITGGDDITIKIYDINLREIKECIDVNEEVKALALGCGKLAYGQTNKLQMVELQDSSLSSNFNPSSSILLTNFNSNVRKIVFNEKLNLIVAFSEDDDLHVINLNSLDVFQYKSNHDGSLKNIKISPKGDFLLTTGCDGYLSIYEFDQEDVGKIINKKKLKISSKLNLESAQTLDLDINEVNLCIVGGHMLIRTLFLDPSFSSENITLIHEHNISHKDDINFVKWYDSQILISSDLSNNVKVWNFSNKSCLFSLEGSLMNIASDNCITSMEIYRDSKKEFFNIIFVEKSGNLNVSNNISINTSNFKEKNPFAQVNKFKPGHSKSEIDVNIDNFIDEIENYGEDQNDDEQKEKKIKEMTEELMNLSDLEDENGEIKDRGEIEKAKEEKKNIVQKVESFADDIIGCLPQQPFFSSTTNVKETDVSKYLSWNMIGCITSRQESGFKAIDISFADLTNKKKISFIDVNDLCYAVMNNCGALFANKIDEENEDEYENEDARKNAVLEFKNINLSGHSMLKDWIIQLPPKENPISLAMGVDWCCVYSSNFFLRIFSLYGNQRMILSLPQVICMAGYENHLAYVYHSSLPLFSNQSLRLKILNSNAYFNEIYDGVLPLSPEATLTWFGYSEDGVLLTLDSRKILRGFFFGVCTNWIPLLDIEELYSNSPGGINFWMIGMQDEEVYGLELKGFLNEPVVGSKIPIKVHKLQIPFIISNNIQNEENTENNATSSALEEKMFINNLFIKHDLYRNENFNFTRLCRNVRNPDFYYTDSLKDESDIHKKKIEHDKVALSLINNLIYEDQPEKIIGVFDSLMTNKSRQNAIKIVQYHDKKGIENLLSEKLQILKMKEENEKLLKESMNQNVYSNQENQSPIKKSSYSNNFNKTTDNHDSSKNVFKSYAINMDNIRALEEEALKELGVDEVSETNQESESNILRPSINLEKKNVRMYKINNYNF
jgi:hypothetical protein